MLWPGLGFTSAYFYGIADALPGRAVGMDPPGFGHSSTLDWDEYERAALAERTARLLAATGGVAFVGHSIGAAVGLALAVSPPPSLRAVVMIDGGYLRLDALVQLGSPVHESREKALEWARSGMSEHATWGDAFDEVRGHFEHWSKAAELATRDVFQEIDGCIRESSSPDACAALILALRVPDPAAVAAEIRVPTLLVASGRPQGRELREPEWERFGAASPLVDLHVRDDWNHHPFQQAPEESGRLVGDWLRAHL